MHNSVLQSELEMLIAAKAGKEVEIDYLNKQLQLGNTGVEQELEKLKTTVVGIEFRIEACIVTAQKMQQLEKSPVRLVEQTEATIAAATDKTRALTTRLWRAIVASSKSKKESEAPLMDGADSKRMSLS